ncbi:MAG: ABC transporter ATP-binding protein [Actinomycetales bacterium]
MSGGEPTTSGGPEVDVEVRGLTKRFGGVLAVDQLTFSVPPGRVTGFLGPNGAGKTTTLRMALGLVSPTAGSATIGGLPYADLVAPQRIVGAALEATGFHPGRTGRNHLRILAATAEVPDRRVDEVLAMVGLTDAARRRTGEYSLGMRQRLGLAGALLADPRVLLLDEPANGLDPEGIAWLRGFLRYLAAQGRTVLVSSHVLSEVQQTVDDVVIVSRGRLVRASTLAELEGAPTVLARSPRAVALVDALRSAGLDAALDGDVDTGAVRVTNGDPAAVGHAAYGAGIELHELRAEASDLERIFLQLTGDPAAPGAPS